MDAEQKSSSKHKMILVILVTLVVVGLIQSLLTGSALIFLHKDMLFGTNKPIHDILIQGGEDSDPVSRKRRDHVKKVLNIFKSSS